jgi:hypothetical protein
MNEVAIFGAEVLASVLVSAFIVIRVQGLLRRLKSSLLIVLIGQFAGLVLVGRAVWKSIIAPATVAAAATPVAAAATTGGAS